MQLIDLAIALMKLSIKGPRTEVGATPGQVANRHVT
jgi:hypothetical protein